ncbi:hypothetical protein AXF42_Ash021685 [Apostasia shenzhenica]|uniref:Tf2-1-like SH3-like domain-containing protein n=1 Tax=Apostasia shenzhenica TaxID=1088818 RepID=A0A2H9ZR32_9ASPA|nr:hypothetical protein AXF42_Ash021685 [Apostasia shenzhenica]
MIRVRPERFPSGVIKKLQARGAGPFKILKKFGSNAYVVDFLPSNFGISTTFNISDLVAYKEPTTISVIHLSLLLPLRENLPLSIHFHSLPQKKSKLSRFLMIR